MVLTDLSYSALKAYQRQHRDHFPENLSLRVHRALSWLSKAEQARANQDTDTEFIYYWISFNAAYANEFGEIDRVGERELFEAFLSKIADLDTTERLYQLIWQQFSGSIRLLMDNKFVYQPFWDYHRGRISEEEWQQCFSASKVALKKSLAEQSIPLALALIFFQLYTLRNQSIHGDATCSSQLNLEQKNIATLKSNSFFVLNCRSFWHASGGLDNKEIKWI